MPGVWGIPSVMDNLLLKILQHWFHGTITRLAGEKKEPLLALTGALAQRKVTKGDWDEINSLMTRYHFVAICQSLILFSQVKKNIKTGK